MGRRGVSTGSSSPILALSPFLALSFLALSFLALSFLARSNRRGNPRGKQSLKNPRASSRHAPCLAASRSSQLVCTPTNSPRSSTMGHPECPQYVQHACLSRPNPRRVGVFATSTTSPTETQNGANPVARGAEPAGASRSRSCGLPTAITRTPTPSPPRGATRVAVKPAGIESRRGDREVAGLGRDALGAADAPARDHLADATDAEGGERRVILFLPTRGGVDLGGEVDDDGFQMVLREVVLRTVLVRSTT